MTEQRQVLSAADVTGLLGVTPDTDVPPTAWPQAHMDVLFVGAHPDDEYINLSTFGQWHQYRDLRVGIVTVTRGEGGGNAVGPEEGAELGLIREDEERAATGLVGIEDIFYLDKPDFFYTLSAPLIARIWDAQDTLERLVRLFRMITPYHIVIMDPRPFNQHGGHQLSARLAIEAFLLAGDPTAFPAQLAEEGLEPWQPRGLLAQNGGFNDLLGPDAATRRRVDPATGLPVFGVWSGTPSRTHGTTWAQVERDAVRKYVTQGFAALPPTVPSDPAQLDSDWFSVLAQDGRVVEAPVHEQSGLRPLYAEFRDWARRVGMPWLANNAQPDYPPAPSVSVPEVAVAPVLDGKQCAHEYPGPELPLRYWQGEQSLTADISATAKLSRHGDDLYVLIKVSDDQEGVALDSDDAKRHWRTDSIEIVIDPRGDADDTSVTFKAGILPFTAEGRPMAARDGDNDQGPAARTAPGMRVVSAVTTPYCGYSVEVKIPLGDLPTVVDPDRFSINILIYDSDTQDKTGQTRLAWSPFGSAQADPYVWGRARLTNYIPRADRSTTPRPSHIPTDVARSTDSPAALAQARRLGVPIAADRVTVRCH